MKVAICGFQHAHIGQIAQYVHDHPDMELVAAAESDPGPVQDTIARCRVEVKYDNLEAMLNEVDCDVVAVADFYARRGPAIIRALEAGKHVVTDKPLCITLAEYERIEQLSRESNLSVILQLTLRYVPLWHVARKALLDGEIGEIATVAVFGRHPLKYRSGRPDWYFEEGKQGGTINDLMIHGVDGVEWLSGLHVSEVIAARAWCMELRAEAPHFQDAAQAMLKMENDAGIVMDCSYKVPVGHGDPWVLHFNGDGGDLDVNSSGPLTIRKNGQDARELPAEADVPSNYIEDLYNEITGAGKPQIITTADSLRATRTTLILQAAADEGKTGVPV